MEYTLVLEQNHSWPLKWLTRWVPRLKDPPPGQTEVYLNKSGKLVTKDELTITDTFLNLIVAKKRLQERGHVVII